MGEKMKKTALTELKILIAIKISLIVLIYILVILWRNSLPPAFTVSVLITDSLFALSTIGDYGLYIFIKKWRRRV